MDIDAAAVSGTGRAGVALVRDTGARNLKVGYGSVLLVGAGVCGYLATLYGFMPGMGAFVLGIAGLSVVGTAFGFTGSGPCPTCGKQLSDVPKNSAGVPCPACGAYATVSAARIFPTADDAVAPQTTYAVRIEPGTQPPFPPLCVGCSKPAAARLPWKLRRTVVGAPGVGRIVREWSIDVPFCETHGRPGALGLPTGITSVDGTIMVQSHRVWRALTGRARY
ncbi:MAG: hypothetical protein WCJ30_12650 [Deltaproteobacteria bacterium]